MHYVISDIHGCLRQFKEMLELIRFNKNDELYVLGDCIDRDEDPIGVLELMMQYDNIIPLIGNHEYIMISILPKLLEEVTDDSIEKVLTKELLKEYFYWLNDGGQQTINGFRKLSKEQQKEVLDYIREFILYQELSINNQDYLLVHSLPDDFNEELLDQYSIEEIIFGRFDYQKRMMKNKLIIVGHTPTIFIDEKYAGKIYKGDSLYNIDCGAFGGYPLGCLCLETKEEFYVK